MTHCLPMFDYVLLVFAHFSLLIMCCSCLLYVVHHSLCVVHASKLLTAHHVYLVLVNYSLLFMCCECWYFVQGSLCVAHGYYMLFTMHYVLIMFAVCCSLLILYVFLLCALVYALCFSLPIRYSLC